MEESCVIPDDFYSDFYYHYLQNSPLASFMREPLFKPTEFYASKRTSIPPKLPAKVATGTQTPPDVTIVDNATGKDKLPTPDLLRGNLDGKNKVSGQRQMDSDDELVTHLKAKRRSDYSKQKPKKRHESEDSASMSNELEEDNYIPEVRHFAFCVQLP